MFLVYKENIHLYLFFIHLYKTYFSFGEKVGKRTSHRIHHSIFAKAFEDSKETFLEKFLLSEFEAEASTFNAHKKRGVHRVFILS